MLYQPCVVTLIGVLRLRQPIGERTGWLRSGWHMP